MKKQPATCNGVAALRFPCEWWVPFWAAATVDTDHAFPVQPLFQTALHAPLVGGSAWAPCRSWETVSAFSSTEIQKAGM